MILRLVPPEKLPQFASDDLETEDWLPVLAWMADELTAAEWAQLTGWTVHRVYHVCTELGVSPRPRRFMSRRPWRRKHWAPRADCGCRWCLESVSASVSEFEAVAL